MTRSQAPKLEIPDRGDADLALDGKALRLTNLDKVFWPTEGLTKGDLLRYYSAMAPALLPHLPARPGDGDEALSERHRGQELLHETRAEPSA